MTLAAALALLFTAPACGGDDEPTPAPTGTPQEAPIKPELTVPGEPTETSKRSESSTTREAPPAPTTTPQPPSPAPAPAPDAPPATSTDEQPEPAPQDAPDNDTPPPEDSPAERFEEFCEQNPRDC